jgi:predicted anti-sigma-YlaC factor YlaD
MRLWRRRDPLVCREFVELVTDCLEGTLPDVERARMNAHLAECDGCSGYLEDMRRLVGSLQELRSHHRTPKPGTRFSVRSGICAATPRPRSVANDSAASATRRL